jgi:hypothetical protein
LQIILAEDRQAAIAIETMTAMPVPGEDDVIANGDATCLRPNLLDNARRLVPQHDQHRIAQRAFDHFEIGMAKSDRLDARTSTSSALSSSASIVLMTREDFGACSAAALY